MRPPAHPTTPPQPIVPGRLAGGALATAGLLLAAYPALRPYSDETTAAGALAMSSTAWVIAHLCAVAAFVLLPMGLLGLGSGARRAAVAAWLGAGLVLPYYGAEVFGLHAISARAETTGDLTLLTLAEPIRFGLVPATLFGTGMLLLAASGVLAAVTTWRAGGPARWSALPLAAGLVLFLPQFFGPPAVRVAHGVLLGAGCVLLGVVLARASTPAHDRHG